MTAAAEITSGRVWRPYDDDPLITQDMVTGLDACDPATRERLLVYLGAVVAHRAAPVHTTVAFNALYFGYDVEAGGYVGGPLDFGDFPSVARGDRPDALPVGAMINIRTGGDLLPAEIVYKEGAHPALDPYGGVPGWISGAPSGARGPALLVPDEAPSLFERLVFDSAAFGQGMAPTAERLQRLRRQGRTDSFGHLLVESRYDFADADLGDTDYYARYLVTRGRDQLTSALAPTPLPLLLAPGCSDDELMTAVRGLMGTVRQALASLDAARVWGEYAFTQASMAQRLGDPGPLGRHDLVRLAESTAGQAVPRAGRRATLSESRPVYTALGQTLRARPEWQDALRGTGYPLAVCHANSVLADYARREHEETTGLLSSGVRLTLDDRWQGGGVWRAVLAKDRTETEPWGGFTDEPAGCGWAESFPPSRARGPQAPGPDIEVRATHLSEGETTLGADAGPAGSAIAPVAAPGEDPVNRSEPAREHPDRPTPPASADVGADSGTGGRTDDNTEGSPPDAEAGQSTPGPLWPDDSDLGAPHLPTAHDSQAEWYQPLRLAHVMQEYLPIPGHIGDEFLLSGSPARPVRVVLQHAGVKLPAAEACHDTRVTASTTGTRLDGIAWPLDFFPGIWLSFTWQRGSNVIHARTTLLPQPVTVDGDLIEHRYDPMVLTRDGSAGVPADIEPIEGPAPRQLLLTAIRRLGLLDRFGQAMLARRDVPAAVNAVMNGAPVEAGRIETALTGLLATRQLTIARGSRDEGGHTHHPPRRGEPIVQLVCYRPHRIDVRAGSYANDLHQQASARPDQPVQLHGVAGFLRRIGHLGHEATDEQRVLYSEDHRRFRLSGPPELPRGFTYVRPHKRGR
ncbi:hypothetical protein [Streptomyces graminilatus]|uniref:hypothetical protein n=1 Tax=Streptomyces graminilatus TaxID=1464070 RepID=UPI0006E159CD|nr:hypothetical protein [Streptomyces graminilatus]